MRLKEKKALKRAKINNQLLVESIEYCEKVRGNKFSNYEYDLFINFSAKAKEMSAELNESEMECLIDQIDEERNKLPKTELILGFLAIYLGLFFQDITSVDVFNIILKLTYVIACIIVIAIYYMTNSKYIRLSNLSERLRKVSSKGEKNVYHTRTL